MKIAVPKEILPGERRVALTPDAAGRLVKAGHEVLVEAGAGTAAYFPDAAYTAAGAQLVADTAALFEVFKPRKQVKALLCSKCRSRCSTRRWAGTKSICSSRAPS